MNTPPSANQIVVSKHALERFLERFRLYFFRGVKNPSKEMYGNLIASQVSQGRVCFRWLSIPFYKNMIESEYGPTVVVYNKPCYYLCRTNGAKLIVLTVVPKWYCE